MLTHISIFQPLLLQGFNGVQRYTHNRSSGLLCHALGAQQPKLGIKTLLQGKFGQGWVQQIFHADPQKHCHQAYIVGMESLRAEHLLRVIPFRQRWWKQIRIKIPQIIV